MIDPRIDTSKPFYFNCKENSNTIKVIFSKGKVASFCITDDSVSWLVVSKNDLEELLKLLGIGDK